MVFFQDKRVQIITHVRPGKKKNATHRGRLGEAKRTDPLCISNLHIGKELGNQVLGTIESHHVGLESDVEFNSAFSLN